MTRSLSDEEINAIVDKYAFSIPGEHVFRWLLKGGIDPMTYTGALVHNATELDELEGSLVELPIQFRANALPLLERFERYVETREQQAKNYKKH